MRDIRREEIRKENRAKAISSYYKKLFISFSIFALICSLALFIFLTAKAKASDNTSLEYTSYQVQEGDTLWNVCSDYYSSDNTDFDSYVKEVSQINHISSDSYIHAGQYIVLPYYTEEDK